LGSFVATAGNSSCCWVLTTMISARLGADTESSLPSAARHAPSCYKPGQGERQLWSKIKTYTSYYIDLLFIFTNNYASKILNF